MQDNVQLREEYPDGFVTVYHALYGWKSQFLGWTNVGIGGNEEWILEPYETSYFQYPTKEEAIPTAKEWAEGIGAPYVE